MVGLDIATFMLDLNMHFNFQTVVSFCFLTDLVKGKLSEFVVFKARSHVVQIALKLTV